MKIPVSEPPIGKIEIEYVLDAVKSGWVSGSNGPYIDKFENEQIDKLFAKQSIKISPENVMALDVIVKDIFKH